jgi:hypothetical protein
MAINTYHTVEEINGVRCSVVEKKISADRAFYITRILESSGYEVKTAETDGVFTVGVTDILCNIIHALYSHKLFGTDKKLVTPAQWHQKVQDGEYYWEIL